MWSGQDGERWGQYHSSEHWVAHSPREKCLAFVPRVVPQPCSPRHCPCCRGKGGGFTPFWPRQYSSLIAFPLLCCSNIARLLSVSPGGSWIPTHFCLMLQRQKKHRCAPFPSAAAAKKLLKSFKDEQRFLHCYLSSQGQGQAFPRCIQGEGGEEVWGHRSAFTRSRLTSRSHPVAVWNPPRLQ